MFIKKFCKDNVVENGVEYMSKIIFIDVDGTLVDYDNVLPPSAVEAIRKARANGHKIFIRMTCLSGDLGYWS